MKLLTIFIVTLIFFSNVAQPYDFECYECEDCDRVNDDMLASCPLEDESTTTESSEATTIETTETENADNENTENTDTPTIHEYNRDLPCGTSHHCYKITIKDEDGETKINRGCVEVKEHESACGVLTKEFSALEKCRVCSNTKCNNSTMLRISLITMLMTMPLLKMLR